MTRIAEDEKIDLQSKFNEAEVYRSMGLLVESLNAYEKILSDIPKLDSRNREKVEQTMGQVKKEIVDEEQADVKNVSTEDISILKKAVSNNENVQAVLASASAWKELGLYGRLLPNMRNCFSWIATQEKSFRKWLRVCP